MQKSSLPERLPKTKIIATIGPATWDDDVLKKMIERGMTVARINTSFADHDELSRVAKQIRNLSENVALMLDTQGHKICINKLDAPINIQEGDFFEIGVSEGNGDVWVDYLHLLESVSPGDSVLIDDGNIELEVVEVLGQTVRCEVKFGGQVKSQKTVTLPGKKLTFPPLTQKDREDIEYAVENKFDFVSASFIRNLEDVAAIKKIVGTSETKVIAKIENSEGIENFDRILEEVDGIMVARGDLGVEMEIEKVPIMQKMMVYKCRKKGKPVVVATQMLESMRESPRPTRAEMSDVANAVFDGADAVMLSAETSVGEFPVKAVEYMAKSCIAAEDVCHSDLMEGRTSSAVETDAIGRTVIELACELPISKIVVGSKTGNSVLSIARHRPIPEIVAFVGSPMLMRQLNIVRGVRPIYVEDKLPADRDWIVRVLAEYGLRRGYLSEEDMVIMVTGSGIVGKTRNSIIEVAKVFDICRM
ncbi:pyruvate kinase [Candidatus Dojkabacteria bacterium]|nr:pyruvate kinase [Candidatus Dojkabacteria bacterium]